MWPHSLVSSRKKKKILKEQRKQRERVELKMDLPGVSIADDGDTSMFSLRSIHRTPVRGQLPGWVRACLVTHVTCVTVTCAAAAGRAVPGGHGFSRCPAGDQPWGR